MKRLAEFAAICLAASTLPAGIMPVVGAPSDGPPTAKALAAVLACDAQSMTRVAESKAAFGPVTLERRPGAIPNGTFELDEATFAKPIEASGLHLYSFVRYVVVANGRPMSVSFGFRTVETAPVLTKRIGELMKGVETQMRGDQIGWFVELEPKRQSDGGGSAVDHRHPLRMVLVSPNGSDKHQDGAMVECELGEARVKGPPPKLGAIFDVAAPTAPSP